MTTLMQAPSRDRRRDLLRKNMADVRAGRMSRQFLAAKAEEAMIAPRWKPQRLHEAGLHRVEDVLSMIDMAGGDGANLLRKDISNIADASGTFMVRPDVEDMFFPTFLEALPLWSYLPRIPARGVVHPYRIKTGRGSAALITELQAVPADHSTGAPLTAPMAVAATQRGASLLEEYVAQATGGAIGGGVPDETERDDGVWAIGNTFQFSLLQSCYTISGHTGTDAYGTSQSAGFYGLRVLTNNPANAAAALYGGTTPIPVVEVAPTGTTGLTGTATTNLWKALRLQATKVAANGGRPDLVILGPAEMSRLMDDMPGNVLIQPSANGDVLVGYGTQRVRVNNYIMDILEMPGGMGTYLATGISGTQLGTNSVADVVVMDRRAMALAWLGQDTPVWFQNSFADNVLSKRWLVAFFGGPVYHYPNRICSIRVQQ